MEIPVSSIDELKVGDKVKQIDDTMFDGNHYAVIDSFEDDTVVHTHNDSLCSGMRIHFTPFTFLKIVEEKQMKKPETQIETDALKKAKKDVVDAEIDSKASAYREIMRQYIELEKNAQRYRKEADELADVLGITKEEKKQIF